MLFPKGFPLFIVLFITCFASLETLNVVNGEGCFLGLSVKVSAVTTSLDGFTISVNGMEMTPTDSQGSAFIPLSEDYSNVQLKIEASKDEHGKTYKGFNQITAPCFNASAQQGYPVLIRINQ